MQMKKQKWVRKTVTQTNVMRKVDSEPNLGIWRVIPTALWIFKGVEFGSNGSTDYGDEEGN